MEVLEAVYRQQIEELKDEVQKLRREVTRLSIECINWQEIANRNSGNLISEPSFTYLHFENVKLQNIIENMNVGVGITDNQGNALSLNKAALEIHGFQSEEEMFSRFNKYTEEFELQYPDGKIMPFEDWPSSRAIRGEFVKDYEVKLIQHKTGNSKFVNYSAVPIYNTTGNMVLLLFNMTDNTKMHQINEALRESEQRYWHLFNNKTIGIAHYKIITDEEGNPADYTILSVNDAYTKITGINRENIEGKNATEIFPWIKSIPYDYIKNYGEIAIKGGELTLEHYVRPLDQWFSIYVYSPKKGEFTTIFNDISERKRIEEELKVNEAIMESFFEASPGLLTLFDQNLRFIRADKLIPTYFNLDRKSILGKSIWELNWPLAEKFLGPMLKEIIEKKVPILNKPIKETFLWQNETPKFWSISFFPVALPGGEIGMGCIGANITDLKNAEANLAYERELFEGIFNNIPVMITIYDPNMQNFRFNKEFKSLLSWTEEDAMDGNFMEKVYPDPEYRKKVVEYMQSLEKGWKEYGVKAKDGSDIDSSWANILLTSGTQIGIGIDIRERKKAEEALRESEQRLQAIFNNAALGIVEVDNDDKFVYVNERICQILGYSREELLRKTIHELTAPEDRHYTALMNQRLHQGEFDILNYEKRYIKKDNSTIWVNVSVSAIRDKKKNEVRSIGIIEDISDRKQMEQKLKESEEKFRLLFENITEGIALHEIVYKDDKPVNYRITHVNPAYKCYCGIDEGTAVGSLATDLYHTEEPPYFAKYLKVAETREPIHFETFFHKLDRHFIINVVSPKKGQFATVFEDITEQKRIEKEMQQKNEELTRFIYTVSHDLKSPLVTIKSFATYLVSDIEENDTEAVNRDIGYIKNAADKMGKLLDELLELSRIGRKEDPKTQVPLQTIANIAIDLVAGRLKERNINVEFVGPQVMLYGHQQRLIQLYQNLIDNAAKFMGNQPNATIQIGSMFDRDKNNIILFVQDNGIGIDPRYHHKIFGLFEKLDSSSEGTGIGLALIKRIVEVHGGTIWFNSEGQGKGTTFYFTLEKTHIIKN